MPGAIEIRRLTDSDVEDFRTIRLSALRTAPDAFGSTYASEAARSLNETRERIAGSEVFGAYVGGEIVGMIALRRETYPKVKHKALIWGFFVEPRMQNRGVGARLMTALIEAARGTVEQITLMVVKDNEPALALYERFGFVAYGVEPRALKTEAGYFDEVLMVKFLGATES
ncbi:MAG: GNAT family N-acetyltransferase [Trueperaceae bacterium]|nr:GNAT family N-acetyltransferase [Trueperaceae bacterium]